MTNTKFQVGDYVQKSSGYLFPGVVVSVFFTTAGLERYVVESTIPQAKGMLHIYNGDQLEAICSPQERMKHIEQMCDVDMSILGVK